MNTTIAQLISAGLAAALLLAPPAVAAEPESEARADEARTASVERASDETSEAAAEAARSIVLETRIELDIRLVGLTSSEDAEKSSALATIAAN